MKYDTGLAKTISYLVYFNILFATQIVCDNANCSMYLGLE